MNDKEFEKLFKDLTENKSDASFVISSKKFSEDERWKTKAKTDYIIFYSSEADPHMIPIVQRDTETQMNWIVKTDLFKPREAKVSGVLIKQNEGLKKAIFFKGSLNMTRYNLENPVIEKFEEQEERAIQFKSGFVGLDVAQLELQIRSL